MSRSSKLYTVAEKLSHVFSHRDGKTLQEVTDEQGGSAASVSRWNRQSNKTKGALSDSTAGGDRKSHHLKAHAAVICDIIKQLGCTAPNQAIVDELSQRTGFECGEERMRIFRHKYNLPRKTHHGVKGVKNIRYGDEKKTIISWDFVVDIQQLQVALANNDAAGSPQYQSELRRKNAVYAVVSGQLTLAEAAQFFDVEIPTLRNWIKVYQAEQRLKPNRKGGDFRSIDLTPYTTAMCEQLRQHPRQTYADIVNWLQQEHQVSCSISKVGSHLRAHGYSSRKLKQQNNLKLDPSSVPTSGQPRPVGLTSGDHQISAPTQTSNQTVTTMMQSATTPQVLALIVAQIDQRSRYGHQIPIATKMAICLKFREIIALFVKASEMLAPSRDGPALKYQSIWLFLGLVLAYMAGFTNNKAAASYLEGSYQDLNLLIGQTVFRNPPSVSTLDRFQQTENADQFSKFFSRLMALLLDAANTPIKRDYLAGDAKTHRGSIEKPRKTGTWTSTIIDHKSRQIIAYFPSGPLKKEPSAMIKAIESKLIDISGCTMTADALYCYKQLLELIIKHNGHYLVVVRSNNKFLYQQIQSCFHAKYRRVIDCAYTFDPKHNRVRICWIVRIPNQIRAQFKEWKNMKYIVAFRAVDIIEGDNQPYNWVKLSYDDPNIPQWVKIPIQENINYKFHITDQKLTADQGLEAVSGHWGIEENHCLLDVTFREDDNQSRKGNAPFINGGISRVCANLSRLSQTADTIKGNRNWANQDLWHLICLFTRFHVENPSQLQYFKFKQHSMDSV